MSEGSAFRHAEALRGDRPPGSDRRRHDHEAWRAHHAPRAHFRKPLEPE
ncbi:hypothetical protein [Halomonas halophila]